MTNKHPRNCWTADHLQNIIGAKLCITIPTPIKPSTKVACLYPFPDLQVQAILCSHDSGYLWYKLVLLTKPVWPSALTPSVKMVNNINVKRVSDNKYNNSLISMEECLCTFWCKNPHSVTRTFTHTLTNTHSINQSINYSITDSHSHSLNVCLYEVAHHGKEHSIHQIPHWLHRKKHSITQSAAYVT